MSENILNQESISYLNVCTLGVSYFFFGVGAEVGGWKVSVTDVTCSDSSLSHVKSQIALFTQFGDGDMRGILMKCIYVMLILRFACYGE